MEKNSKVKPYRFTKQNEVELEENYVDNHLALEINNTNTSIIQENSKLLISNDANIATNKRKFGSHITLWLAHDEPVFTIGPHWPFFICMWTALVIIGILVNVYAASHKSTGIRILCFLVTAWEAIIYLLTALKNPGIMINKYPEQIIQKYSKDQNFCKTCNVLKEMDTYHCLDCDVCIKGYDHHCPWTGKCIGEGNIKLFYAFLLSTVLYLVVCILITIHDIQLINLL